MPLSDGVSAMTSKCWDGLLCQGGKPDTSSATPTELNLACQAQDAELDTFGCVEQVVCVDSADECVEVAKTNGIACWTGQGATADTCLGHACADGQCVVDESLSVTCTEHDLPDDCDAACQACTKLTCHWIPDPDASGEATKQIRYCQAAAAVGQACEDGSECSIDDVCVLKGQTDGPLGKETLGTCQSGEGKTKEDCLADMNKPTLPCLVTGVQCTEEDGCTLDQEAADEWCYPPDSVCFDLQGTYCTYLDPKDGLWDDETGCHTELLEVNCDDENECTIDKCKADDEGVFCEHKPVEGATCNDDDPCTTKDVCVAGECSGKPKCTDATNDPCSQPGCDETGKCVVLPISGGACDDGNVCTQMDTCQQGLCVGEPLDCDDNEVCTTDSCDADAGCQNIPIEGPCDDGNACTTGDMCIDGQCSPGAPVDCDDGDICTDDSCDPGAGCKYVNNASPCDDGNACTEGDICKGGACKGQTVVCDDGNPCTDDACEPDSGCVFKNNLAQCDDKNACTTIDQCAAGSCVGAIPAVCDDDNLCTDDSCEPEIGCVYESNNLDCDDGDACTILDKCNQGQCSGQAPLECEDDNPCTDDSCDVDDGCLYVPNQLPCDDDDVCTSLDSCVGGVCVGGEQLDCDDDNPCTEDGCDPGFGCSHTAAEGPCNDGNACTPLDTCNNGQCVGTGELSCDDFNICTDDSCAPGEGCVHTNNTASCDNGETCFDGACTLLQANQKLLAAGSLHTCVLRPGVGAWCWGDNSSGQLGDGCNSLHGPASVPGASTLISLSAGDQHTYGVSQAGKALGWGRTLDGEIYSLCGPLPACVPHASHTDVVDIGGTGQFHTCVARTNGAVKCWGLNSAYQLGHPTLGLKFCDSGWQPLFLADIVALAAGSEHTIAIKADGTLWTWGDDKFGQLGTVGSSNYVPTEVASLSNVTYASGGKEHTCSLHGNGMVHCWGNNANGQLGLGHNNSASYPLHVSKIAPAAAVECGWYHTCGLLNNGTVWCWGNNGNGQLGLGNTVSTNVPKQVIGITGAIAVSAGASHTCALKADDSVWCWGSNSKGQLGDGTTFDRWTPVEVQGLPE